MKKCVYGTITGIIDFPSRLAVSVYMQGCNLRCSYCHNMDVVEGEARMTVEDVLQEVESLQSSFLSKKIGVVLTGGEPTANPMFDRLVESLDGYPLSIHTNGLILPDPSYKFESCILSLKSERELSNVSLEKYVASMNAAFQWYDICGHKELRIVDVPFQWYDHHKMLDLLSIPDGWKIKWVQMSS